MRASNTLGMKGRDLAARSKDWQTLPVFDSARLTSATCGDSEFISEVLQAYFTLIPDALDKIQGAIDECNAYALRYHAHSAKGSSQAVGADRLAAMFHVLEKELDIVDAELVLPSLRDEMRQVQAHFQSLGLAA